MKNWRQLASSVVSVLEALTLSKLYLAISLYKVCAGFEIRSVYM